MSLGRSQGDDLGSPGPYAPPHTGSDLLCHNVMGLERILPQPPWEGNPPIGAVGIEQANGADVGGGRFLEVAGWKQLTVPSDTLIMDEHLCLRKWWLISPS